MKKVIEGALYNTETAKEIGAWHNGDRGFNWCKETLYRTKSGKYFLSGEGGARSKYGEWHGNSGGPGSELRPYTPVEAAEWAEEHLNADEFEAEFGEPDEASENTEVLICTIPKDLKTKLRRMSSEQGRPMGQIVAELIGAVQTTPFFKIDYNKQEVCRGMTLEEANKQLRDFIDDVYNENEKGDEFRIVDNNGDIVDVYTV